MTKSELIERLCAEQTHLSAKEVEDAVKDILEHMASTLESGDRIEIRGFGSFLFITVSLASVVTLKRATKWNWKVNTFHISNLVKSFVSV
ncbi:integration host factor beta-subunit [Vibrio parahaemolyticus AQ3810]|nr:integration host factor beta-subunit [Vibrio parahaemolyticus AQ3810]